MANKSKQVYQFKITLQGIEPKIWRRILVPEEYSFWDLHVAIQDAMGWDDAHLHQFNIIDPKYGEEVDIGIPSEDDHMYELEILASWEKFICKYFSVEDICLYKYDFGDGWEHEIKLEKILPAVSGSQYPICIDGKRACPPEDCGGIFGYRDFLKIINNPKHEEYETMLEWVGGEFDPELFVPEKIHFDNPKERLKFTIGFE